MMRKFVTLFFCVALIFISIGPAASQSESTINSSISETHSFDPLAKFGNWIKRLFGVKRKEISCDLYPSVVALDLSRMEIKRACPGLGSKPDKLGAEERETIEVVSIAADPYDRIVYTYHISGGEIVGKGPKVIWNLSGVPPGTYTITAGVDDGAGVLGKTSTKSVKVIQCENPMSEPVGITKPD